MALSLSVLDLAPVSSGSTATQALQNMLALARRAEQLGYTRYWLAEHHNMPGIASSSPEILIGQVARETSRLRVGSGGIMLPNHAPLKVAEDFLTLENLFPGRIDLGIGRAPGTDPRTALALRRSSGTRGTEDFPEQLTDLFAFASGQFPEGHPYRSVAAMPNGLPLPPVWLLGSSDYSAHLAAQKGLGFVYAHHINPYDAEVALRAYRENFTPSAFLSAPEAILTVSVICAESEAEAEELATSLDLAWLQIRSGRPAPFPSPAEARAYPYSRAMQAQMQENRVRLVLGDPPGVRARLCALAAQTGVQEVMVTTLVHSHTARIRSYELLAELFGLA